MITKIDASVEFWGEKFSPTHAEECTGLTFDQKNEVGEPGHTGRYKGQPKPFGAARLKAPTSLPDSDKILWLANVVMGKIERLAECGLEDAHFSVAYYYQDQCNCSLSKEESRAIADVGVDFWFSCYGVTEDKE